MQNECQLVGKNVFGKCPNVDGWVLLDGPWFYYLNDHCHPMGKRVTLLIAKPEYEIWLGDDPVFGTIFPVDELVWGKIPLSDPRLFGFRLSPDGAIPEGHHRNTLDRRVEMFNRRCWR